MTKNVIEWFLISFKKNLIDIKPKIKAEIMPVTSAHGDIVRDVFPAISGTLS